MSAHPPPSSCAKLAGSRHPGWEPLCPPGRCWRSEAAAGKGPCGRASLIGHDLPTYGEVSLLNPQLSFLSRCTFLDQSHLKPDGSGITSWGSKKARWRQRTAIIVNTSAREAGPSFRHLAFFTPPPNTLWSGNPGASGSNGPWRSQAQDYINFSYRVVFKKFPRLLFLT